MWCLLPSTSQAEPQVVDVATGGLASAAEVIASRHGARVTFEDVPPVWGIDVLEVPTEPSRPPGQRPWKDARPALRFTYEGGAREAALAAIAAWSASGGRGDYALVESGEFLHLVPTTRRLPDGAEVPFVSPLDREVTIPAGRDNPENLWNFVVTGIASADVVVRNTPVKVGLDRIDPSWITPEQLADFYRRLGMREEDLDWDSLRRGAGSPVYDNDLTLSRTRGTARDLLDELTIAAGASTWSMHCGPAATPDRPVCWVSSKSDHPRYDPPPSP